MSSILQDIEAQISGLKTSVSRQNVGVVREISDGVAKVEAPKRSRSALDDSSRIPTTRERPIFHPTTNIVHLVIHGTKVVWDMSVESIRIT